MLGTQGMSDHLDWLYERAVIQPLRKPSTLLSDLVWDTTLQNTSEHFDFYPFPTVTLRSIDEISFPMGGYELTELSCPFRLVENKSRSSPQTIK